MAKKVLWQILLTQHCNLYHHQQTKRTFKVDLPAAHLHQFVHLEQKTPSFSKIGTKVVSNIVLVWDVFHLLIKHLKLTYLLFWTQIPINFLVKRSKNQAIVGAHPVTNPSRTGTSAGNIVPKTKKILSQWLENRATSKDFVTRGIITVSKINLQGVAFSLQGITKNVPKLLTKWHVTVRLHRKRRKLWPKRD